ncbi:hypothetical protein V6B08_18910 [Ferrovibrio sp. MS7]|jgi:hypothetical protein|uniref:DUF6898 family protein n=1 Tax=Ferrovibrio plantarum TaxID=3119164 RepID=UPI001B7A88D2|nr:hypothetical protein [Ferrovibrio sp.]
MTGTQGGRPGDEVIVEFIRVGSMLKVVAVDTVTGLEVSMVGDPRRSTEEMKRLAAQKLRFVLAKKQQGQ